MQFGKSKQELEDYLIKLIKNSSDKEVFENHIKINLTKTTFIEVSKSDFSSTVVITVYTISDGVIVREGVTAKKIESIELESLVLLQAVREQYELLSKEKEEIKLNNFLEKLQSFRGL